MKVVILGNGVAGITAAIRIRQKQPDWSITVISGESEHHYSRPALMYVFMGHMRYEDTKPFEDRFWKEKRIDLVRAWVTQIDVAGKRLHFDGQAQPMGYDRLLVATGSTPNKFGWPGQDLDGVQGLYGLQDLELLSRNIRGVRHAVVVGGGLIGIELAEMLRSRNIPVTFLVRETAFWNIVIPDDEARMINRIIEEEGLGLVLETELREIVDDGTGRVTGVVTSRGDRIDCQFVGLTTGVRPNIAVVERSGIPTGRGVLVDRSLRTRVSGVYAAGDCAEIVTGQERNLVQQVWYTGRMQGRVAGDVIAGEECAYDPGIWFNSAKFLDLEYQVYGRVEQNVPGEGNLFWMHRDGRHSLRIVYTDDGVIGFNLLGIRYRHEVCERWIREQRPIDWVLEHLGEANFDPEFFERYEREIVRAFELQLSRDRSGSDAGALQPVPPTS
ncbi:MAG: NAD(P)/FAD-dependent oxidoreductase [Candidatus Krumholzibacteriia bacterium]